MVKTKASTILSTWSQKNAISKEQEKWRILLLDSAICSLFLFLSLLNAYITANNIEFFCSFRWKEVFIWMYDERMGAQAKKRDEQKLKGLP